MKQGNRKIDVRKQLEFFFTSPVGISYDTKTENNINE